LGEKNNGKLRLSRLKLHSSDWCCVTHQAYCK